MATVLYNVACPMAAALIWAAFAFKLRDLRRRRWRDAALWAICVSFGCAGLVFSLAAPWVYWRVDVALRVPNLAALLIYGNVLGLAAAAQVLLLVWIGPPHQVRAGAARRLLLFGFALVVMIALFVRAPVDVEDPNFAARYATTPYVAEFLTVSLAAFTIGYGGIARLGWRYAAVAGRLWLGRGLRLTAIGAGFGVGYCAFKGLYLAGRLLGNDVAAWNLAAALSALLGVPFLVVGLTIPAWGPRLSTPRAWVTHYRANQRLYPLWRELCRAVPDIALQPPTGVWRDRLRLRRLEFRLHRRIMEIYDALLILRPYRDPQVAENATALGRQAGLEGEELQAVVEAASLAVAVQAKTRGSPAARERTPAPLGQRDGDLDTETAWLGRVAVAYSRSPVVRAVLAGQQAQWQEVHRADG